jgi:hypothetical protein
MFPKTQYAPAEFSETLVHVSIALPILVQLWGPKLNVGFRTGPVQGAGVPKAAVNKHREPRSCKHDVWFARQLVWSS